jgi:hypothetical protein
LLVSLGCTWSALAYRVELPREAVLSIAGVPEEAAAGTVMVTAPVEPLTDCTGAAAAAPEALTKPLSLVRSLVLVGIV